MVSNNAFPVRDMSPYCEDVAKMTNLCNEIFTNLACPKTCTSLKGKSSNPQKTYFKYSKQSW